MSLPLGECGIGQPGAFSVADGKPPSPAAIPRLIWSGDVPHQKWMNFYTKVLSRFVTGSGLKLKVEIEVKPDDGISQQKVEQTKVALRELGLNEDVSADK